ncbi:glycosyltransferase family 4 protein [Mycolicibacterium wolinskyi]|uniref:Glycosyltransferase n=1 Tax=Mycolicibacterium wolinskyi TaxID=59750 RepID=A0A132PMW9_9MYCO|nr:MULTISPECIES: glycosyltransferase family 4 protein [Mycolicibacterium]KWX23686.1 glycosyltransferase [Mycolicibacterium wolinskyi]MCV7285104.1 glycosyltransferase family 4 protein [Mycolicibacterium wolinskyi]MCV7292228.1 glycosyltransferase family 4 protein [Mycolicibacterium goodii]ORX11145.1 glycosyltransferase [Mycolicibacterium wolinskyi]
MSGNDFANSNEAIEPLRIVLVAPPYFDVPPKGYGGTEAVVADLADALVKRGHRVTLLGAGEPGTAASFKPLWRQTMADRLGQPYPEIMHALKVRRAIEHIASTDGVDLIHDHTFAGPLNTPAYRNLGLPTLVTVHGPIDDDLYPYYRELGDDVGLIAISDRQRELAPDLNWVGRVHNALRIDDWPFRSDKGDYALFLGRYAPYKGAHLALQAAHEAGMPLVLAGKCSEPSEQAYFDEQVRPLLTENDHVFGQADAVSKRKLLAGARCLLFPIQWEEPFGMVMIEAMACGTPVVALRGGAVPEVVVDGVTGVLCDRPEELATAIDKAQALDPAACRRHVAAHFAVGQFGSGYERIYRSVLGAPQPITLRQIVEPGMPERASA